jgi:predicted glycosyltransferase
VQHVTRVNDIGSEPRWSPAVQRAQVHEGRRTKVFLYSHDTFGLGHLRRNLAIARRLLSCDGAFAVRLLTGSPVISKWELPEGLAIQPLPPVVKTGAERYEAREPGRLFGMVKGYREALILKLVLHERPDVFLVDHAPAGMNGELLSTLALIRQELPHTRVVLGLRDILDSPDVVRTIWAEQQIMPLLAHAYDDILVYGSRALFDVAAGYGMTPDVAAKLRYCGHVVAAPAPGQPAGPCWSEARAAGRPVVLVTAGGGGDGFELMRAYAQALKLWPASSVYSVIVLGPLMPPQQSEALQAALGKDGDVELVDYTTNLVPSLRAASLIVSMAGYNTTAEIIAERKPAILVPRAAPRAEQLLRARQLAALGLVRMVEPDGDLPARLAELVPAALNAASAAEWERLDLGGAGRVATLLQDKFTCRDDAALGDNLT